MSSENIIKDSFSDIEDWSFSAKEEKDIILSRFCGCKDLLLLGEKLDIDWFFEVDEIEYSEEEKACSLIIDEISNIDIFENVLREVEIDKPWNFSWFSGYHYVIDFNDDIAVREGPDIDKWEKVFEFVSGLTEDDSRLYSLLNGLISNGVSYSHYFRSDLSSAASEYNKNEKNFWSLNIVEKPAKIPGIETVNTQNDRKYRIAIEMLPILRTSLDNIDISRKKESSLSEIPDNLSKNIGGKSDTFNDILSSVDIKYEDVREFKSILYENDALEYWKDYIAPMIKFRDKAKKAILCMLASPNDKYGTKGRTNAIIYGPPGTGKSAFKNFIVEEFGAYSIDGARVSKADLTYNKKTDEDGLLVRAHRGLAVIEEADEMDEDAYGAALTSLGESGIIEIRDMRLPAEVRGVMIGNYNSKKEIINRHGESLFNRFEFIIYFGGLDKKQKSAAIDLQYDYFRQPKKPTETIKLKKYLSWVRDFEPSIPEDQLKKIKKYKHEKIEEFENVREGISIMNVAYTIARLNHRNVTLEDYKKAFNLVKQS